jgi:hypothetical protein
VLSICGGSFKAVGKAFQVKLVEIRDKSQEYAKLSSRQRVATLKNLNLFHTFLVTT